MSLLWATAASHYPVYEVGDPSDWDERPDPSRVRVTPYGEGDKVDPAKFGMPRRDVSAMRHDTRGYEEDARVPTKTLQASQGYVYGGHVRDLASLPQHAFDETHSYEPVSVVRTRDGHHVVTDGHHRAAAAIARGDSHLLCRVEGTEV